MDDSELSRAFEAWQNAPDDPGSLARFWEVVRGVALRLVQERFGRQCHCGRTATDVLASVIHPPQWLKSFRGSTPGELICYLRASIRRKVARLRRTGEARADHVTVLEGDRSALGAQEETAAENELRSRLAQIVAAFEDDDRVLWQMRFEDEADYEQIAKLLNIEVPAARQRFHRIAARVRHQLGELA